MKKLLSITAITTILATPAFATITNNATCDTTNLGQSENNSTANVEADWTANTININWYIDDNAQQTIAQNTCTYDGTITLPQEPTKTGYTFNGWQLRAASAPSETNCFTNTSENECIANSGCRWCAGVDMCTDNSHICLQ